MASAVASVIRLEPVVRERMADLETPVSAFAKLRSLGGAFLLESAEHGERMGRYSFIGVAPRETIVSRDADPLLALRAAMARYRKTGGAGLPRFSGHQQDKAHDPGIPRQTLRIPINAANLVCFRRMLHGLCVFILTRKAPGRKQDAVRNSSLISQALRNRLQSQRFR